MASTYTREELENLRRSEIRTIAVSDGFDMSPKDAVSAPSKDLIEYILSKQGGEKKAAGGKKAAAKAAPVSEPEETPEEAPEEAPAATKTSKKEEATTVTRINKLGEALDTVQAEMKSEIGDVKQQVYVLMAMVKLMLGTTDLEPKDIDEAIEAASAEFEEQGKE
jgi:hypothetical protein